ncbi:two-component system response regulator AdeR [Deinobacterium chartae]|uniref:Two-component system response regulator AdeR n=1 Tax=Deinobacterium chartae TaxID=521158 RepID=A0A841HZV1_9DEIO|nr:response regulator transcription factor [Deinobacterium chartae]MBB6097528.1 two-component system response regulator AdeR [Deinobacterium chartae]
MLPVVPPSHTVTPLVLVVEDEPEIADIVEQYLRHENFRVERAADGLQAVQLFRSAQPNLVILDVMLPGQNGLDVLRHIRSSGGLGRQVGVIMLTARAEEVDQLLGLELGADDYVVKPFRPRELIARVRAVLRRSQQSAEIGPLRVGPLEVLPEQVTARVAGNRLELTPTEFRLLECLARSPGRAFSRQELLEYALPGSNALERVVDSHLLHLRQKLARQGASHLLQTVRGVGYRLGGD